MHIQSIVENELVEDVGLVWRLKNHNEFGYSDGSGSERYLQKVFSEAKDLSTHSVELEAYIKDWPSEYHLSAKRAHLLSGFTFDRSLRVLEVGCGCGAITRHLGENFDQVISVEGNIKRARLARQRTRDLESVSVICAPFQEIKFSEKFDIIFCIGVFEYSAAFIVGDDPYDAALRYFADMLAPNGMVVVAIENQFGLKYFNSAREDHLGVMFEGLEGYHRNPGMVRTFGKVELELCLKKYFPQVEFYYPYPDYKIPDCVLSSEFLSSGHAGELVSQMRSRDYSGSRGALWDEMATALELNRNGMLEFFSNSFLVIAGRDFLKGVTFDQLGILFSSGRKPEYATQTRIVKGKTECIRVEKRRLYNNFVADQGPIRLIETSAQWIDANSVLTLVTLNAYSRRNSLGDIFAPCKKWVELLLSESVLHDGVRWVDGAHIDSIWSNSYIIGGACRIIDREWVWNEKVRMNVVLIRAIYDFLCQIETSTHHSRTLTAQRGRSIINDIAATLGIKLRSEDFAEFVLIESKIASIVSGASKSRQEMFLRWFLFNCPSRRLFRRVRPVVKDFVSRFKARISNALTRRE